MKTKLLCLIMAVACLITGCGQRLQMENRGYVMAMGIDYNKESMVLKVTFAMADLAKNNDNTNETQMPSLKIVEGRNLDEVIEKCHKGFDKRLDFGQIQTVVFGKTILAEQSVMETVIHYMKKHQEFNRNIYICAADQGGKIMEKDQDLNGSVGVYIRDMIEQNSDTNDYQKTTLNDLIVAAAQEGEDTEIIYLAPNDQGISMIGKKKYKF